MLVFIEHSLACERKAFLNLVFIILSLCWLDLVVENRGM